MSDPATDPSQSTATPPAISVVIPVYNRRATIREAVESVLRQTWTDFELIVVDDCSKDDTVEIVEKMSDPRVRLVRHEVNKGAGGARNTGMEAAKGTWIAFQDSDDEWLPRKLELQMKALEEMGPDAIGAYCGMFILGNADDDLDRVDMVEYWPRQRPGFPLQGNLHATLLHRSLISTQTFIGRRDQLAATGRFDTALPALEDWDFFISFSKQGPIAFVPDPLVIQRFSPNSLTRSLPNRIAAQEAMLNKHMDDLRQNPTALVERLSSLAGGFRQLGQARKGLGYSLTALKIAPTRLRSWLSLARLLLSMLRPGSPAE